MIDNERINNAPPEAVARKVFELIDWLQVRDHSDSLLALGVLLMLIPSDTRHRILTNAKNMVDHPVTHRRGHFAATRMFIEEDLGLDLD